MKVKLLRNVFEADGKLKTTIKLSKQKVIGWFAGEEFEVSEETGKKLIERGDAVRVAAENDAVPLATAEG